MSTYLENLNASSCQYQLSVQEKLKEICKPIFQVGIKHFGYAVLFENGSYLHVSTHNDYVIKHNTTIRNTGNFLSKMYPTVMKNTHLILPSLNSGEDMVIDLWIKTGIIKHHFSILKNYNLGCLYAYNFFY